MTDSLEQRVTGLEELVKPLVPLPGRVKDLETFAGPGQNEALSKNIAEFRGETNGHFADVKKSSRNSARDKTSRPDCCTAPPGCSTTRSPSSAGRGMT